MFDHQGWFESLLMTKELCEYYIAKVFPVSSLVNNNITPIVFTERPNINGGDHWTKELMQRALDPDNKFQDVDALYTESMYIVLQ
jgi:hypothetical protein